MIDDCAKPRQAEREEIDDDWYIELKYDGSRQFLIQEGEEFEIRNKRGYDKTRHFPEISELPGDMILDGEMVVFDDLHPHGNKSILQRRDGGKAVVNKNGSENFKQKMKMKQYPVTFVAFDILKYDGKDMRELSIEERREKLKDIVEKIDDSVIVSERFDNISDAWGMVKEEKMEGVIVKKPESEYPTGRTSKWKKIKNVKDTILKCHDYEEHDKGVTAIGEDEEGDHRFTVNGRQSKKVKEQIEDKGEAKVEVSYLERTDDGNLREPTFKRLTTGE